MLDHARTALRHHHREWYIDDLVKDVRDLSGKPVKKTSLVSSLSRFVRAGDTFTRPKVGYYGLLELERGQQGDVLEPVDFGSPEFYSNTEDTVK